MELQPPGAPVADPFLAAVRRRHPDVDVVLLAPAAAPLPEPDPVDEPVLAATLDAVDRCAGLLWAAVDVAGCPRARCAPGPRPGTVVVRSRHGTLLPARPDAPARLADALAGDDWGLQQVPGAVHVLTGHRSGTGDRLALRATYAAATGALVVRLESRPLAVGHDRARRLVRS